MRLRRIRINILDKKRSGDGGSSATDRLRGLGAGSGSSFEFGFGSRGLDGTLIHFVVHDLADFFRSRSGSVDGVVADDDDIGVLSIFSVRAFKRLRRTAEVNHVDDGGDENEDEAKRGDS